VSYKDKETLKKLYWDEGMSMTEIGKKYGVSNMTILYWMNKFGIERRYTSRKGPPTIEPDLSLDLNMAYVLGVCKGDASVDSNPSWKISLGCNDRKFRDSFYKGLEKIGLNPRKKQDSDSTQKYWVRANSKKFCKWFNGLDIDFFHSLLEKESLCAEFIRGLFESEGSLYKPKSSNFRWVSYSTTEKEMAGLMKKGMEILGVKFVKFYKIDSGKEQRFTDEPYYQVKVRAKGWPKYFIDKINPVIKNSV